ncbi:MAG: glutamate 5-kinase [Candidatus Sumerlaeia bacterium]|nr:glutamate 5-kinase [Candidatus Sumerlaeia bacterium]
MSAQLRQETLARVKRVVIKLGSAVLSREDGRLDRTLIASLAEQVGDLRRRGVDVLIVSSGAVSAGMAEMSLSDRPAEITSKQALAAIGQSQLMRIWADAFAGEDLHVAQVLLSRGDLDDRQRYLNARGALLRLLEMGVIPIINENDTTAIEELTFGDNDILSAAVAAKVEAQLLVILTIVQGLHGADGRVVSHIEKVTDEVIRLVRSERSKLGRGGMESKLLAAKNATTSGVAALIASGKDRRVLDRIFAGEPLGTWFEPARDRLSGRKRWIALGKASHHRHVVVDEGAAKALVDKHRSLLPIGVREVSGPFGVGDVIEIRGPGGQVLGRGLVNYTSQQVDAIRGAHTHELEARLGATPPHEEIIHRDNLIIYR